MLRAHQLPPKGTGGATAFADTRAAYDDLHSDVKVAINDSVVAHSLWHSRKLAAPDCEFLNEIDPKQYFMGRHKLVQLHEASGRMNIYIAHHAHHVEGMETEEGQELIRSLLQHASQDKYTFKAEWENDGDIIIWVSSISSHKSDSYLLRSRIILASCTELVGAHLKANTSVTCAELQCMTLHLMHGV